MINVPTMPAGKEQKRLPATLSFEKRLPVPIPFQKRQKRREFCFAVAALIAFALCCHIWVLVKGGYFANTDKDSSLQMMYFVPFLQKAFLSGQPFWSWSAGLGSDILGGFSFYYTGSPFFWLSVLLRALHIGNWDLAGGLVWKLLMSVVKQILAMLFLYILLRREGRSCWASLVGAMCYGGCIWFFCFSLSFDFMTDAILWLPLMLLCLRHDRKTGQFLPAVLCGAGILIDSFYYAYMSYIFLCIIVLVFLRPQGRSLRERAGSALRQLLRYALMAAGSLGLSAVLFLPSLFAFRGVDRFYSNTKIPLLFSASSYLRFPEDFFFISGVLGLPLILLVALVLPFRRLCPIAKRKTVLFWLLFAMYLIPGCYSLYNGFSYVVERWLYLLIFAAAYALPDWLDENDRLKSAGIGFFLAVALAFAFCLYTFAARGASAYIRSYLKSLMPLTVIAAAGALAAVLALSARKYARSPFLRNCLAAGIAVSVAVTLAVDANLYLGLRFPNVTDESIAGTSCQNKEEASIFSALTPKTNDFYRVVFRDSAAENVALSYGYYGAGFYSSLVDGSLFRWLRRDCDVRYDTVSPNRYQNFDDRLFLESLFGVRYLVQKKSDGFLPFGYKKISSTENYTVYEAEQKTGLSLWYSAAASEKALEKLSPAARDAAMLQLAGVEGNLSGIPAGSAAATVTRIPTDFEKASGNGAVLRGGILTVAKNGEFDVPIKNRSSGPGAVYFTVTLRPVKGSAFSMNVNGSATRKSEVTYAYTYPLSRYTFRLEGNTTILRIRLTAGTYSFTDPDVSFSSYSDYADWMNRRSACPLHNLYVNGGTVRANVACPQKGVLALAVPFSNGWHASVDGRPARLLRVNGELSGLALSQGAHNISLQYITPGFLPGVLVTLLTALVLAAVILFRRHRYGSAG